MTLYKTLNIIGNLNRSEIKQFGQQELFLRKKKLASLIIIKLNSD